MSRTLFSSGELAVLINAVVLLGCSSEPSVLVARQLPSSIRSDAAAIASANNQFTVDLLAKQSAGNAFFSPFSLSTVLSMLHAGAVGQTETELRAALHLTLSSAQTNDAYGALLTSLDTGRRYGGYSLAVADRLFGQQGFDFQPDFLLTTKTDFHAELMPIDFAAAPDDARHSINQWVADQTGNTIAELFTPGSIDSDTRLALVNAIAFRGNWAVPFHTSETMDEPFHIAGGSEVIAHVMHEQHSISVAPIPGGRLGILPYEGNDLSMLVFLPDDPDGLPQVEAQLSAESIADGVSNAVSGEAVQIALPSFTLTAKQDLKVLLPELGINAALSPSDADFSSIDGARDLYVQSGFHEATITVDERGAAAVAGTGASVGVVSALPPFVVDHSFAFAIYDNVTGAILFFGRVQDPTQP